MGANRRQATMSAFGIISRPPLGDKPLRWQYSGRTIFQGDDDEKVASDAQDSLFFHQSCCGLLKGFLSELKGPDGLFSGEKIEPLFLTGINPRWEIA